MSQDYVDMLQSLSCAILLDKPTRITNHSATLIDHFIQMITCMTLYLE